MFEERDSLNLARNSLMSQINALINFLDRMMPINRLSPGGRRQLLAKSLSVPMKAGQKLKKIKTKNKLVYLLEGDVHVDPDGLSPQSIKSESEEFFNPVFQNFGDDSVIIAESPVTLIAFDELLYLRLVEEERPPETTQVDNPLESGEADLYHEIFVACLGGDIELPPMPDVATKLQKLKNDDDSGLVDLGRVIQLDPVVSGRIMQVANSAFYRGACKISGVKDALLRLGYDAAAKLALSIALKETFKSKSPIIDKRMQQLWRHSIKVSATSFVIAKRCPGIDAEYALLAGLLHDIGVVPVLDLAQQFLVELNEDRLDNTIHRLRADVGVMVMESWDLGVELNDVITECENWHRESHGGADYCDVVMVAQLLAAEKDGEQPEWPELDEVSAVQRLSFADGASLKEAIHEQAESEINEMMHLLSV